MEEILSLSNPLVRAYLFYASILIVKMILMSFLTAGVRNTKKVYANPEDQKFAHKAKSEETYVWSDPLIERIRRAHLNDLENIVPFLVLGIFYVICAPAISTAMNVFRAFTGARVLHSVVYLTQFPQPSRALCFISGAVINLYMAYFIITTTM